MIIPRYGFFGLGAFFGVIITMILDELFIGHYDKNHIIFWVLSCVLGIGCGVLSFIYWRKMVIWMSTISGSFLIVRGFSLIFGHWPSNFDLALKI